MESSANPHPYFSASFALVERAQPAWQRRKGTHPAPTQAVRGPRTAPRPRRGRLRNPTSHENKPGRQSPAQGVFRSSSFEPTRAAGASPETEEDAKPAPVKAYRAAKDPKPHASRLRFP
jgi:hypothetical protein